MDIKKFFSGLVLATLGYLVIICLLLAANASVFSIITADVAKVKDILADSGAYAKVGPALVEKAGEEQKGEDTETKAILANPEVKKLAGEVFDVEFAQTTVESVLTGIYSWLNGETSEPKFSVNVAQAKENFINKASNYAAKRLDGLPPCRFDQLSRDIDVFTTTCAPPGITRATIRAQLDKELDAGEGILGGNTITSQDLVNDQGKPVFEQYGNIPEGFQWAKLLPWMLGLIGVVAAVGLVLISPSRRSGLKRLSIILIVSSVLLMFTPPIIDYAFQRSMQNGVAQDSLAKDIIYPIVNEFNDRAASIYYVFAAGSLAVGLGLLILRKYRFKLQE